MAFNLGVKKTSYCQDIAVRYRNLKEYSYMGKWLSKIKYTVDKNYGVVISFLDYKNPFVKRVAIAALAESGLKKMSSRFMKMYSRETGLQTRLALLKGLMKLKLKVPTQLIHQRLKNKKIPLSSLELRICYRTLGRIGAKNEVRYLISQFKGFKVNYPQFLKYEKEMKQELIVAMGHIGGSLALRFFSQAKNNKSELFGYKEEIIKAAAGVKVKGSDSLVITLAKKSGSVDSDLVAGTLAAIGVSKNNIPYVVSKAQKMFTEGKDIYLFLNSLKEHHYKNYDNFLKTVFASNKLGFNSLTVAAEIITKYAGVEFVPQIISKLKRVNDLQIISILVRLLGDLGSSDSVVVLKKYLQHDAPGVSFLAAEALHKITGKKYKSNQFGQ